MLADGHQLALLNRGTRPIEGTEQLSSDRDDHDALCEILKGRTFDAVVDTNCYTGRQAQDLIGALGGRVPSAVMISSAAVYADAAPHPPSERAPTGGSSAWGEYGREKTEAEAAYRDGGFRTAVALRPPYLFGPNDNLDRATWFFRRIVAGRPVLVPGLGRAKYQFLHEDDLGSAVRALLSGPQAGFRAFNVADPEIVTSADFPQMLADAAGRKVDIHLVGAAAGDLRPRDWYPFRDTDCMVEPAAFMHEYGWRPASTIRQYFREIFQQIALNGDFNCNDWTKKENLIWKRLAIN
jgi:nucleoside-diphosphate-sugar epimerase